MATSFFLNSYIIFGMTINYALCKNFPILGTVTPFLNQTSVGVYRFFGANPVEFHSYWYQDNLNNRLALGIGKRGQDLQAHFWFFNDAAYELVPKDSKDQSKGYHCVKFIDFNYTMEIAGYDDRYLKSMGAYEVKEANETFPAEFFLGVALDGVGPLNVIAVVDRNDGTYAKLYTTQKIGFNAYSEYYLYPRNDSIPADHHFELADECKESGITEVEFFKKFNMKGERIDLPGPQHCSGVQLQPLISPLLLAISAWILRGLFY